MGRGILSQRRAFFDADFGLADRGEVVVERRLVVGGEVALQGACVFEKHVKSAGAHREFAGFVGAVGDEELIKDPLGAVLGGHVASVAIERHRGGSARAACAAVGRHDEAGEASFVSDFGGENLVERNGVLVGPVDVPFRGGDGTGQELVGVGVAVNIASPGMGEAADDGQVFTKRLKRFERIGEFEIAAGF